MKKITRLRHRFVAETAERLTAEAMEDGKCSLSRVAKRLKISPWHLSRVFREQKGVSYSQFLKTMRMGVAQRALSDYGLEVKEVAAKCGFTNADYFSVWFKKQGGRSPEAFRAIKQSQKHKNKAVKRLN